MAQARVLTEKDIKRVLSYIGTKRTAIRDRALVMTGLLTGMRAKELSSIRIADVLGSDAEIRDEIHLSSEMTKGSRGRTVLLNKKVREEIRNYLCERFKTKDLQPILLTDTSRALFSNQRNNVRGFTANGMSKHLGQLFSDIGIDGASAHSLRRSYISKIASFGTSIRVIQKLAGHQDIKTTALYIEVSDSMLRKAVELA
jgi:integrase/recombinase XerD